MTPTERRLAALGGVLLLLTLAAVSLHLPGAGTVGSAMRKDILMALLGVCLVVWLLAVRLRHGAAPRAGWIVLGLALAMRAILLPAPPFLSSDLYRYVWDGRVQNAGINPYRYIPADPALASLRDATIYPRINRANYAPTIYPPGAQIVFAAINRISGSVLAMKLAMFAFECIAMACLLRLLALAGLPAANLLIYAWNPLPLWCFALDGHVDAIAIGVLALALLARATQRQSLAGALLAWAVLVKFIPLAVAPAFLRGGRFWRPAIAGAAVIVGLYALYLSAGSHVLGFLSGYGKEEGLDSGTGFWLLDGLSYLAPLPRWAAAVYVAAVLAGFAWLSLRIARAPVVGGPETLCRDVGILAACATAAISPHYPWYFAWIALPTTLAPLPALLWLGSAPILLYLNPFHDQFVWPSIVYLPALALLLPALRHTLTQRSPACPHPAP